MREPIKWSACNPCERSRRGVWKRDEGYGEVGREWEEWVRREWEGERAGASGKSITMERKQGTPAFAHNGHDDDDVVVVARM